MSNLITIPFLLLCLSALLILVLLTYVVKIKEKKQIHKMFSATLLCVFIICIGVLIQEVCYEIFQVDPIIFENFIYIGTCFLPVTVLFTGLIMMNGSIKFRKRHILLLIIPIISLIVLWTNQLHHLFFVKFSLNINDAEVGSYMMVHTVYTYLLLFIGIILMVRAITRSSGFFSRQLWLIILGSSIPIVTNFLGTLKIIPMTVYITPISFAFTMLFWTLAIFKFKFLGIQPIALQVIVNRISDGYLVINEDDTVTDFNTTFLKTFQLKDEEIRDYQVLDFFKKHSEYQIDTDKWRISFEEARKGNKTISFEQYTESIQKYFTVEITPLYNKEVFLGNLILLKDITQHTLDMQTIKENQEMLVEQERLASLGQMIGGISHNLKTPIMSIAGAAQGLNNLINEYDASIGDKDVTNDDHHAIAKDMREWISKINSYTNYMSDIIGAVKGQAATLSESEEDTFTLFDLIKRIQILMKNELQNNHIQFNISLNQLEQKEIKGNVNSLVQVINNLITNAIQAYRGNPGEINLSTQLINDELDIAVEDHGCGMPKDVQEKLFKEMVTTKGKNGTGLGLFMSYSTIKGKFDGDFTFTSEEGKGTVFHIHLPIK